LTKKKKNKRERWRSHILKTLQHIKDNSDFASISSELYPKIIPNQVKSVSIAYSKMKKAVGRKWTVGIPQFEIPITDKKLERHHPTLLIGGVIEGSVGLVMRTSFSICITFTTDTSNSEEPVETTCRTGLNLSSCCLSQWLNKKRIVRRFHFDFQPSETDRPISHMQYGGKFPEDDFFEDWHYCLEHFLDEPRIHYPPMDLALLLNLIIREFKTPLEKWKTEDNWKGLVIQSQELWWKDYMEQLAGYLNRPQGYTFHEIIYGDIVET